MRLEPQEAGNQWWPRRMLYPDRQAIEAATGLTIAPYQLKLDAAEPDGYLRSWKVVGKGPEQNYGYAFQWSAFTTLTIIFYVILMRRWLKKTPQSRAGE
jgi:surfeit locus 1 family protein